MLMKQLPTIAPIETTSFFVAGRSEAEPVTKDTVDSGKNSK
jgi:hypothetical protein